MSKSRVTIQLHGDKRNFQPGETLRAEFVLDPAVADEVATAEWSLDWRTEGTG